MNVRWSRQARLDLEAVHEYIAQEGRPGAADKMIRRILARESQMGAFPHSGRAVPEFESLRLREFIEQPYRIIYAVREDEVFVLAVVHSSRVLRPEMLF